MARKRDYYQVLGVGKDADDADVKRAYRELARKWHPDLNPDSPDATERFKEINEAYAVLSDKQHRTRYDKFGHDGDGGGGLGSVMDAVEEVLGDVLRRRRQKQRGRDLRYTLQLTFVEAALGTTKTITVPEDGAPPVAGPRRQFSVVIPPGTKEGSVKMIKGEGEAGRGGAAPGDLHVIVRIREHEDFRRDGYDVLSDTLVSFAQAALGAVIDVATLDGPIKMRIPAGTQPGRTFRIRGRGIPRGAGKNAARGDHLVKVQVDVPTELTPRQRELIEELGRLGGEDRQPVPRRGFIDRVRSLLDD
ncbi:MAG: J domain-containing protein [Kofleriaceae bacterium]|nr:J domain-containing protein [Myxococcales bacterium]MCB9562443.1 J domain-containing protein [Kofleriaceae bacterium]